MLLNKLDFRNSEQHKDYSALAEFIPINRIQLRQLTELIQIS